MHVLMIHTFWLDSTGHFNWTPQEDLAPYTVLLKTREYTFLSVTEEELVLYKLINDPRSFSHTTQEEYCKCPRL